MDNILLSCISIIKKKQKKKLLQHLLFLFWTVFSFYNLIKDVNIWSQQCLECQKTLLKLYLYEHKKI